MEGYLGDVWVCVGECAAEYDTNSADAVADQKISRCSDEATEEGESWVVKWAEVKAEDRGESGESEDEERGDVAL